MRSIRLIWIGKSQEPFVQDGIKVYLKKLSHYIKVDFEEIKPVKYNSGTTDQWRRQETEKLLKRLDSSELNIFLMKAGSVKPQIVWPDGLKNKYHSDGGGSTFSLAVHMVLTKQCCLRE